jgi:hypothetical protein
MTRRQATLFNAAMVFTLLIGVGTLYIGLFVFDVITAALVIDSHPLRETLGHPVGIADRLNWRASSAPWRPWAARSAPDVKATRR